MSMAYCEGTKSETEEMKQLLRHWGRAMERFNWKETELQKVQEFYEMQKKTWERFHSEDAERKLEQIEKEQKGEVRRLRIEMVEILREKACMDSMIKMLSEEEEVFVKLRFENGYGFDYIGGKMHMSRATLFRMQNKVLQKLILYRKNGERERDSVETL